MTELLLKKKKNTDGSITKSWRFEYVNEKGVRKFKQSKNKDFLKEQAEGIAKKISNVISMMLIVKFIIRKFAMVLGVMQH